MTALLVAMAAYGVIMTALFMIVRCGLDDVRERLRASRELRGSAETRAAIAEARFKGLVALLELHGFCVVDTADLAAAETVEDLLRTVQGGER